MMETMEHDGTPARRSDRIQSSGGAPPPRRVLFFSVLVLWGIVWPVHPASSLAQVTYVVRFRLEKSTFLRGEPVFCQFVIGVEMVSGRMASHAEGIKSVLEGVEWCAQNGVQSRTHIWCNTPGSLYEPRPAPPTEYFLTISLERHKILQKYDMYFPAGAWPAYSSTCHRCGYLSADSDFQWLLGTGQAEQRAAQPA